MRLHARSALLVALVTATLTPFAAQPASAANAMVVTDLGSAFQPAVGLAVASPISAAGSITVANASGLTHTYVLSDLATGATTAPVSIANGATHTYGSLRPNALFSLTQVGGVSRALVVT